MDNNNNNNNEENRQQQEIITECSPSFCACDPSLDRCQQGFPDNRAQAWNDESQDFHMYMVQQRINATVQDPYPGERNSMIRRQLMASRLNTQQNPASMFGRFQQNLRRNVKLENSSLLSRRPCNTLSHPFGMLVPEQAAVGPLQHLAAPQGHDYMEKNYELECDENGCISGDSDSSKSLEQSRKKQSGKRHQ